MTQEISVIASSERAFHARKFGVIPSGQADLGSLGCWHSCCQISPCMQYFSVASLGDKKAKPILHFIHHPVAHNTMGRTCERDEKAARRAVNVARIRRDQFLTIWNSRYEWYPDRHSSLHNVDIITAVSRWSWVLWTLITVLDNVPVLFNMVELKAAKFLGLQGFKVP